jgi:hypothetical protein
MAGRGRGIEVKKIEDRKKSSDVKDTQYIERWFDKTLFMLKIENPTL